MINLSGCDFADFGSGLGGCIDFAKKKLFGYKYLGFEKHKGRCKDLKLKGYNCLNLDITKLVLPKKSVRFVTISHVLEHLDNETVVSKVIKLAVDTAKEFVFIEGPSFEFDEYLENLGLKFSWRDGHGHIVKLTISRILEYVRSMNVVDYSLLTERPYILNSNSVDIHSIKSPPGVHNYDVNKHPSKPTVVFNEPVFRSFIIFLWLKNGVNRDRYLSCRSKFKVSRI